jgi:hypothetical protein
VNLKGIRDQVFAEMDWAPDASSEAVERLDGFIDRAYQQLALEAPFLFFESAVKFTTQADASSADDTDTVSMVTDDDVTATVDNPWVFRTDLAVGSGTAWNDDRSWDGRHIEITDDDGVKHRNQIRSVWKQTISAVEYWCFSLLRPWPATQYGTGPFAWRVFTPHYYLPDDLIELRGARIVTGGTPYDQLDVLSQTEAEDRGYTDNPSDSSYGTPTVMFRREHFQLPGPNSAPEVVTNTLYTEFPATYGWLGPEPVGEFEYCVTYCWGKRDVDYQNPGIGFWATENDSYVENSAESAGIQTKWARNRMREPLFESAPSPIVSTTVSAAAEALSPVPAVQLRLPNIEYMQGFMLKGTSNSTVFRRESASHSGWHVRIYRRRLSADFTNYDDFGAISTGMSVDGFRRMDIHDEFFLMAEMRIDEFNAGMFFDNGTILPDFHRRLRDVHGYQGVRLYPSPGDRYEIECRCIRRPQRLKSDSDAPAIHSEATSVLINKTLAIAYAMNHDPVASATALARADRELGILRKRYGDLRPSNRPRYRKMAKASGRRVRYPILTWPR